MYALKDSMADDDRAHLSSHESAEVGSAQLKMAEAVVQQESSNTCHCEPSDGIKSINDSVKGSPPSQNGIWMGDPALSGGL